jgi:hypothetical protein
VSEKMFSRERYKQLWSFPEISRDELFASRQRPVWQTISVVTSSNSRVAAHDAVLTDTPNRARTTFSFGASAAATAAVPEPLQRQELHNFLDHINLRV